MLSTLDLASYAVGALTVAIYGYVAFSALAIGRTLPVRLYRRQAIGMGLVTIILVVDLIGSTLSAQTKFVGPIPIQVMGDFYSIFIGIFYWIDASVRAARLTDPLLRDTLHWSRLRIAFWAYDLLVTAVFIPLVLAGQINPAGGLALVAAFLSPGFILSFAGIVVLPIASHRSKDKIFRKHLNWFGLFVVVALAVVLGGGLISVVLPPLTGSQSNLVEFPFVAFAGYFLYRSARSLVPLYMFAAETVSRN